jgi:hypothetical protein
VTFHEQVLGCHAYINRARNPDDVVKGYEMMARLINDFKVLPLALGARCLTAPTVVLTHLEGFTVCQGFLKRNPDSDLLDLSLLIT